MGFIAMEPRNLCFFLCLKYITPPTVTSAATDNVTPSNIFVEIKEHEK